MQKSNFVKFMPECMNVHCTKRKLGFPSLHNDSESKPKNEKKTRSKIKKGAKEKSFRCPFSTLKSINCSFAYRSIGLQKSYGDF
jgi:hypothetical protein